MRINAFIKGQQLTIPRAQIVAGSNDYQEMNVVFQTGDWDGLAVTAFFAPETDLKNPYTIPVNDCRISADQHLNLYEGGWKCWFVGLDPDGTQKITTEAQTITVKATGCGCGGFPSVPPSHAENITRLAELAARTAQSVRDDADAGNFNGGHYFVTVTAEGKDLIFSYKPSTPGMAEIQPQRVRVDVPGVTPEEVANAVADYLLAHPVEVPVQSVNGQTGAVEINAVLYGPQKLTEKQKEQARRNIDAGAVADISEQVSTAQSAAREAGQSASNAAGSAQSASGSADTASAAASRAESAAETALGHADNAAQSATTAQEQANRAQEQANRIGDITPEDRAKWDAGAQELAVGDVPDTENTKAHLKQGGTVNIPETATDIKATVPAGLPPETPKTAQGVLDALAEDISLGVTDAKVGDIFRVAEVQDGKVTRWARGNSDPFIVCRVDPLPSPMKFIELTAAEFPGLAKVRNLYMVGKKENQEKVSFKFFVNGEWVGFQDVWIGEGLRFNLIDLGAWIFEFQSVSIPEISNPYYPKTMKRNSEIVLGGLGFLKKVEEIRSIRIEAFGGIMFPAGTEFVIGGV